MDDLRFGATLRKLRRRRGWRQEDLARKAKVSPSTISRVERGHIGSLSFDTIRAVAAALDMRVDLNAWWRAGDLDRLLNARHSQLHESVARTFGENFPEWLLAPETSFSIYGERGVIDILAFNPKRRALLVIELKTDIADVNELLGGVDRKRRLAARIARGRGWDAVTVSVWVIVDSGRTNRRRLDAHRTMLRSALPIDGRGIRRWLREPVSSIAALSMWSGDPVPGSTSRRRMTARSH